jgi:EAL domain-containing protein (putative c-di-GMP-specific phosphodiesterase class I)
MAVNNKSVIVDRAALLEEIGKLVAVDNIVIAKVQVHNLPQINFQFGKSVGNELLQRIYSLITELPESDRVAQISPALYSVVSLEWQNPWLLLNAITQALEKLDQSKEFPFLADVSVGATVAIKNAGKSVQTWFDEANMAMLYSGITGRAHLFQLETALKMEIRDIFGRLSLDSKPPEGMHWVYQSINRLDTGAVFAYEALCRWSLPKFGEIGPEVFIPIAEELGVVELIDRWALGSQHPRFNATTNPALDAYLSFNISVRSIDNEASFARVLAAILERSERVNGRLIIEITETALSTDKLRHIRQLHELRSHGILIAIDDFGTGTTTLANVGDQPCDFLKIDGSLLHPHTPELALGLLKVCKVLADVLGAKTIMEGIETQEDLAMAREFGADYGQGWIFGQPIL